MTITLNNPKFRYEMENLTRIFLPGQDLQTPDGSADLFADEHIATATVTLDGHTATHTADCCLPTTHATYNSAEQEYGIITPEIRLGQALYQCLQELTGTPPPPWGVLTGVRPTKLFRRIAERDGESAAAEYFARELFVRADKIALARAVFHGQRKILGRGAPQSFSLYVGIPFCPSRCAYCSFVSHSITEQKAQKLIPAYVERLCEEIRVTGKIARELSLRLESVYFGGGTPTTLSALQLDSLLSAVDGSFELSTCREYTVEAGRPDTVTAEKFEVLRRHGVGRVSVNPQTFDDDVLRIIGRAHTAEQARTAYHLAREYGFAVNMDFIAGLPGDTPEGFARSIDEATALAPENITVHALAIKRAARLAANSAQGEPARFADGLSKVNSALTDAAYRPYYSYRQSNSLGALENTGWAKSHFASAYNIYMMEEAHTVLACGAGAVTKLKEPCGDKIERVFNFKFPYEYLSRFAEILTRKEEITSFYRNRGIL
ncbi:MAG: coproporphyrinogen dehydrogenase HemZ [Oscillospiraceae bacterium]|jgi:oxygen-independent coproporphyrinogen-3 oxidase|nr:coproporphyrinogen dehydrogenase HemZ [Oscillospiraceae bacterium]